MILDGWASRPLFELLALLAVSAFLSGLVILVMYGRWWRALLVPILPLLLVGLCASLLEGVGSGSGVVAIARTITALSVAVLTRAVVAAARSSKRVAGALAVLLASAAPTAAIWFMPRIAHVASFVHDDVTRMSDAHAARAMQRVVEAEKLWLKKQGGPMPPTEVDGGPGIRIETLAVTSAGDWALLVTAEQCPLCRSYAVEPRKIHFAEGRTATLADPAPDPDDTERIVALFQPRPRGL